MYAELQGHKEWKNETEINNQPLIQLFGKKIG